MGVSEQPRGPEQAAANGGGDVSQNNELSHDCSGPWSGYPHCEGKMAVSVIHVLSRDVIFELGSCDVVCGNKIVWKWGEMIYRPALFVHYDRGVPNNN